MNTDEVKKLLVGWIKDFVEKPNQLLNGWAPCPYARQARINDKVLIKFCEFFEIDTVLQESIQDLDQKDVVIIGLDHTRLNADLFTYIVNKHNKFLRPLGYVLLEDHPDILEDLNGVNMNFGHCALIFIQKVEKLNDACEQLTYQGYYDNWPEENLENVVSWRYE